MTVAALRTSRLFEGLGDDELERLAVRGEEVRVPAGAMLMEEGSDPDAMFVLLEGEIDVQKRVGGQDVSIGTVREGELVGELGLLHRRPRSAGLRATTPCRLLRIPADALDGLLAHPQTARELLATATRRLEQQELLLLQHGRMAALGTLTAGLLHELNNPASAVRRAADQLADAVDEVRQADRELAAHGPELASRLEAVAAAERHPPTDALARADAEEAWRTWLEAREVGEAWRIAGALAAAGLSTDAVDKAVGDGGVLGAASTASEAAGSEAAGSAAAVSAAVSWLGSVLAMQRLLEQAGVGARRIAEIVGAVKAFSHHDEAPVQDVDIHEGIEAALTLVAHKVGSHVEVRRDFDPDLPRVEGYPGDLNVVWTNLLDNALDAVGEEGVVKVATRRAGEAVVVEIADDGPGMPPEVRARVFDPFFTTKPVGQGTGLGLATTHTIVVRSHHGEVSVDSEPGRTSVTVKLPIRRAGSG